MYPTLGEAVNFWISEVGSERPDQQWILSPYDSWHKNPYYHGPEQRHPEDESDWEDEPEESVSEPTALPFDDVDFKFADDYRELLFRCGITEEY